MPTVFGHDIVTNYLARFPMRTPVFFLRRSAECVRQVQLKALIEKYECEATLYASLTAEEFNNS